MPHDRNSRLIGDDQPANQYDRPQADADRQKATLNCRSLSQHAGSWCRLYSGGLIHAAVAGSQKKAEQLPDLFPATKLHHLRVVFERV
jgi:hypothetical protein